MVVMGRGKMPFLSCLPITPRSRSAVVPMISFSHFSLLSSGLQLSRFSLVSSTVLPNKPWESLWSMH